MAVAHVKKSVTVGAVIGASGMESNDWQRSISKISRAIRDLEKTVDQTPLKVRFVYLVPEEIGAAGEGAVQKKSFSKKDNYVLIEMIVPRPYGSQSEDILRKLLLEGMQCAEKFAKEKHIADHLQEVRSVVERGCSLLATGGVEDVQR